MRDAPALGRTEFGGTDIHPRYCCIASALTISPPTRSATSSATCDLPVPVGPMMAMGLLISPVATARRSTRHRRGTADQFAGGPPALPASPAITWWRPDPRWCREAGSAQRNRRWTGRRPARPEPPMSPGRSRRGSLRQRVGAVGHHQHADRFCHCVDLGPQRPALSYRGVRIAVSGVGANLHRSPGVRLAAKPSGEQRAQ